MKSKIGWIDFLKGISILTVIVDHLYYVVYFNREFQLFTVFSVTLFIFLAGVTSVISSERNKEPLREYLTRRMKGVLIPYVVATVIYGIVKLNYRFDFGVFWSDLILFKAAPPFYFVIFFCQLIIVAPILYSILAKKNIIFQLISLVPIYFVSNYFTHYTEVSGIFGGGGKVLGGSYLFVFYLGMFFYLLYQRYSDYVDHLWIHIIGIITSIALIYGIYKTGWLSIGWTNPPNKQTILYTLSVLLLGYSAYIIFSKWKFLSVFTRLFEIIGSHSYYIFLYHILGIHYAKILYSTFGLSENVILKAIWFLTYAIIFPLLVSIVIKYRSKIKVNKVVSKLIFNHKLDT